MQKQPLHILNISSIFYPKVDGSVIAVSNLLQALHERGHVLYLITRKLPRTKSTEKWQGIPIIRVGPSKSSFLHRFILSLNQARAGFDLMRKEHIDIIHAHGLSPLLTGWILSKLYRKPLIVTFYGFQRLWFKSTRWKLGSTLVLMYPFEKFLTNLADAIVAQSLTLKDLINKMYKTNSTKIHVVPHLIDTELFKFVHRPPAKPVVLFVGTLMRVHAVDLLIKAAPIVLKNVPQAKFIIVGRGPQKGYLQKLINSENLQNSVFLVGPVFNRKKLAKYYAASKTVVVLFKIKGYFGSLVALEAMSTGRPIITTLTLDPDLHNYGIHKVGFDPAELAQVIKDILLSKEETYSALSRLARKYIEERCSKEVIASKLENLYTGELLKHKN